MTELSFRILTPDDAEKYRELRLAALTHDPQSFLATLEFEQQHSTEFFQRELAGAASHPCFGYHGVWHGDELLGYAQIETSYLPKQRHIAFLYNVYIAHTARRQGLAKKLTAEIFSRLQQETAVELVYVAYNSSNTGARDFYHSLGFKRCGIKPQAIKWQGVYDDEVEMVLKLNEFAAK
jgi:ribosomal protein S18 acetylase RimI-like enzyme